MHSPVPRSGECRQLGDREYLARRAPVLQRVDGLPEAVGLHQRQPGIDARRHGAACERAGTAGQIGNQTLEALQSSNLLRRCAANQTGSVTGVPGVGSGAAANGARNRSACGG